MAFNEQAHFFGFFVVSCNLPTLSVAVRTPFWCLTRSNRYFHFKFVVLQPLVAVRISFKWGSALASKGKRRAIWSLNFFHGLFDHTITPILSSGKSPIFSLFLPVAVQCPLVGLFLLWVPCSLDNSKLHPFVTHFPPHKIARINYALFFFISTSPQIT